MQFINNTGEKQIVRIGVPKSVSGYKWVTVQDQGKIDLDYLHGLDIGFTLCESEEKEDLPLDDEVKIYERKLLSVRGIGRAIVKVIMKLFPTEKDLKSAVKRNTEIPIKDKLVEGIKSEFQE